MPTRLKPMLPHMAGMTLGVGALTALALFLSTPATPLYIALALASVAAAVLQLWRPVAGTLVATVLAAFTPLATPAATAGILQTAQRCRFAIAAALAAAGAAAHAVQWPLHPHPAISYEWWLLLTVAAYGALLGWGALARSRRELLISLHERAHRAETEQAHRVAEARAAERRELAREMHDVLAHRLSLVSTYAGALEYRPDAPPERLAEAAGIVRQGLHEALGELRQVIGLLRENDAADDEALVPTLLDLPRLLEEARRADQTIRLTDDRPQAEMPVPIGRSAYRIVQEGLTNARKHAPGLPVDVALGGEPGDLLLIELRNPLPTAPAQNTDGSGLGLVGLAERVRLAGGELEHEAAGGDFRLRARLPWPA